MCFLQKGRNCIAIESDLMQCSFIQQRINAIPTLPDEMQEIGLRKGDFSESKVPKLSKEPQVTLGGMIGNNHFITLENLQISKNQWKNRMTQWKHKMTSKKKIMCLLSMMNLGYMILLISLKMALKTMLNFANF